VKNFLLGFEAEQPEFRSDLDDSGTSLPSSFQSNAVMTLQPPPKPVSQAEQSFDSSCQYLMSVLNVLFLPNVFSLNASFSGA